MQIRRRDIHKKDAAPLASYGVLLLFVVCLFVVLWAIIVVARVVLG